MIAWLHRRGITRDSALWLWAKVVALAGLVVSGAFDLSALGLTDRQRHLVTVACGAIAYLAGQLSTSALQGADRAASLSPEWLAKRGPTA